MLPYATFSTAVTATTAAAFFLIVRNLQTDHENENSSTEAMNSTILAELETTVDEESNEVDFELLEKQFIAIEALETAKDAEEYSEPVNGEPIIEEITFNDEPVIEVVDSEPVEETVHVASEPSADLSIEVSHRLSNSGQHRPYTLSLHFTPRPRGGNVPIPWNECKLNLEWPLPKNVLIDVWSLRRLTPFTVENDSGHVLNPSSVSAGLPFWSVKPRHPDIEVGAYDPKARPFILTAQVPFKVENDAKSSRIENGKLVQIEAPWNLDLHVPDLFVRYQTAQPGHLFQKHSSKVSYIPTPNLQFTCPEELQIDWQMNRLRPLRISLPVGSATPIVSHVTVASVLFSSIFLLLTLFKF